MESYNRPNRTGGTLQPTEPNRSIFEVCRAEPIIHKFPSISEYLLAICSRKSESFDQEDTFHIIGSVFLCLNNFQDYEKSKNKKIETQGDGTLFMG